VGLRYETLKSCACIECSAVWKLVITHTLAHVYHISVYYVSPFE